MSPPVLLLSLRLSIGQLIESPLNLPPPPIFPTSISLFFSLSRPCSPPPPPVRPPFLPFFRFVSYSLPHDERSHPSQPTPSTRPRTNVPKQHETNKCLNSTKYILALAHQGYDVLPCVKLRGRPNKTSAGPTGDQTRQTQNQLP